MHRRKLANNEAKATLKPWPCVGGKPGTVIFLKRKMSGAGRQGGGDGESRGKNDQTPDKQYDYKSKVGFGKGIL